MKNTFNGKYTSGTTTESFYTNRDVEYDEIKFCPFCGKKVANDFKFCSQCGKEIPRTTTTGCVRIHWNLPDGTITYPLRDGIVYPYITY